MLIVKINESSKTRGHCMALVTERCKLDMRKYFFTENTNWNWNILYDCVNTSNIEFINR